MALAAHDVLAGPIVRRVEPDLVSVWIALRKPAAVRLELYRGLGPPDRGDDRIPATPIPPRSPTLGSHTLHVGKELHIAVAIMVPLAPERLEWGQRFAYDLRITEEGSTRVQGFAELGLLRDGTIEGLDGRQHPHLALGYVPDDLPSFVLPPLDPLDLRFAHGSCRLQTAVGKDTMPELDGLIGDHRAGAERLQMLFLTGDQIYADEVGVEMGRILSDVAAGLIAGRDEQKKPLLTFETITVQLDRVNEPAGRDFPVDRLHFPMGRRTHLLRTRDRRFRRPEDPLPGFTSDNMSTHALSIGEYCALYLSMWSNVQWPDLQPLLTERGARVSEYRERLRDLRGRIRDLPPTDKKIPDAVRDRIVYYDAWRLLPEEGRKIDAFLTAEDRDAIWNDGGAAEWRTFWESVEPLHKDSPPTQVAPIPPGMDADQIAHRRKLALALTPSWFAGVKHLGVNIEDSEDAAILSDDVRDRLHRMQWFYEGLPRVRRALANVATYMIFDDHEVTDDWNLNIEKAKSLRENPLSRCIARNALIAYTLFQGWGNDPREFAREGSIANKVLKEIAGLFFDDDVPRTTGPRQPATDELEKFFDLRPLVFDPTPNAERMRWDYRYEGSGFEILALDTRTWRSFEREADVSVGEPFTELANAALMSTEAMQLQIPPDPPPGVGAIPDPASGGFAIVLSPAPVLGFPPVESLFQPILNIHDMVRLPPTGTFAKWIEAYENIGRANRDPEPWGFVPRAFEALLARLRNRRRVIFLSGDVHYGCTLHLSYWARHQEALTTSRFIQLTASAFLKEQEITTTEYFSMDLAQQLGHALAKEVERFGWAKGITGSPQAANPVEPPPGGEFNARVKYLMSIDPILLPPQAVPDRQFIRLPEWSWRMRLAGDERPDAVRLEELNPPQLLPPSAGLANMTKSVADRHRWQAEHAPDRRWLWFANFGVVDFVVEEGVAVLQHALYTFDLAGEQAAAKPYSIAKVPLDVPPEELPPEVAP